MVKVHLGSIRIPFCEFISLYLKQGSSSFQMAIDMKDNSKMKPSVVKVKLKFSKVTLHPKDTYQILLSLSKQAKCSTMIYKSCGFPSMLFFLLYFLLKQVCLPTLQAPSMKESSKMGCLMDKVISIFSDLFTQTIKDNYQILVKCLLFYCLLGK